VESGTALAADIPDDTDPPPPSNIPGMELLPLLHHKDGKALDCMVTSLASKPEATPKRCLKLSALERWIAQLESPHAEEAHQPSFSSVERHIKGLEYFLSDVQQNLWRLVDHVERRRTEGSFSYFSL